MKTCRHCLIEKSDDSFGKAPRNRDLLKSYCRPCENLRIAENRKKPDILERRRAYEQQRWALPTVKAAAKARSMTAETRAMQRASSAAYGSRNPAVKEAHRVTRNAIRAGILLRYPCQVCGGKSEAHHPDYSAPLAVVWLCRQHHVQTHVETRTLDTSC